jgi:hypothetical protein
MAINISYSSELMSNYMQGETVSPDSKFEALQSPDGHSLLFSIGTDRSFYLTEEMPSLSTGWQQNNLSASLESNFPTATSIVAKTFAVAQNDSNNKFSVALVLTVDGTDYLYVASSYTRNSENFISLNWVAMTFDAPNQSGANHNISDIYILQTASLPLIIVDTVPSGMTTIVRYYIDSTKHVSKNHYWNLYTLPVNVTAQYATICGGRKKSESVDGVYTVGQVSDNWCIIYQQLYNPFNPTMAGAASQLVLPNGASPMSIASTPSAIVKSTSTITYTDLYVTSEGGGLYFFTADNQANNATGALIMNNDLFKNINNLYAYTTNSKVVVWGLNRNEQVFYTQCNIADVKTPSAWSYPLPIGAGVEQISPYINRINGGNTFFAHTGTGTFKKVFQDPISTTWTSQDILLATDPSVNATKFDCYMTRITVLDETNSPMVGANVNVSSSYRVPVYVNNHYYVLDTTYITLQTDSTGGIKIVQRVDNLQGACLTVQSINGGPVLQINPMDNAATKVATLNTPETLSAATVTDDKGNPVNPLVSPDTSSDDLEAAAGSIQSLSDAYTNYNPANANVASPKAVAPNSFAYSPSSKVYTFRVSPASTTMQLNVISDVGDTLSDIGNTIVVAAGDLCSFLKNATEYVIQIIEDTAQKVWTFVANVAGQLYTFVIDCVEKVIDALEAIFSALMTIIKDLVQFLKFLFSWDDITRTKNVMQNILMMYMDYGVSKLESVKQDVNDEILALKDSINTWAGLPPAADNLTNADQPMSYVQSQTDYTDIYTSPSTYLQDHFTNNIANASDTTNNSPVSDLEDLVKKCLNDLKVALEQENQAIQDAAHQFQVQLFDNDQYKTMSLMDIIKVCSAIIADLVLDTIGVLIDAIINLIVSVFEEVIKYISDPIWIPVLSNILEEIFGYEFKFSLLDVLCLVCAVPATIIYKILNDKAPFTADDGFSTQIMNAKDYQSLAAALGTGPETTPDYSKEFYSMFYLPESAKNVIFETSHILSGTAAAVYGVLVIIEDIAQIPWVPFVSQAKSLSSTVSSVGYTAAGVFAKPYPIQDSAVSTLSTAITVISFVSGVIFGLAPKLTKTEATKIAIAEVGAGVDIAVSLTAIAPVAFHFTELAATDSNNMRTLSIIDETARICTYLSSICADIAKFDPEPTTSIITAGVSSAIALLNGGLQIAESIVDDQDVPA